MSTDASLDRWILASVGKHVLAGITAAGAATFLHVNGQISAGLTDKSEWFELYVLGPDSTRHSKQYICHYVEVLVGCQVKSTSSDAHAVSRLKGLMRSILEKDINVYRLGTPGDNSLVGCLRLRSDVERAIDGMDFGVVSHSDVMVRRATVEGSYEMFLS